MIDDKDLLHYCTLNDEVGAPVSNGVQGFEIDNYLKIKVQGCYCACELFVYGVPE
jgi:hypothetical protein